MRGEAFGPAFFPPRFPLLQNEVMISVTHLDHSEFFLNVELIECVEAKPDTVITLTTGKRLLVREPVSEVVCRVHLYRQQLCRAEQNT